MHTARTEETSFVVDLIEVPPCNIAFDIIIPKAEFVYELAFRL